MSVATFPSPRSDTPDFRLSRRFFLQCSVAAAAFGSANLAHAQEAAAFSFDLLTDQARENASRNYAPAVRPSGFLGTLDYDAYRLIRFRNDRALWSNSESPWRLHAFHTGWLFGDPVTLFEVQDGISMPVIFSTADFEYLEGLAEAVPADAELPGIAGFRLNAPLNHPARFDEVISFLGASYFRALGRDSRYGLSARGLALNTAGPAPEEFPRFSRFYFERDPQNAQIVTIYALLDGPSVSGAYRMVMRPGTVTEIEVTARLFFRAEVTELGIAPLTSMFLFSGLNRAGFDDYRPKVHDSDGLRIVQPGGDVIWRPLNNPARLAGSYFAETSPLSFGLHQRDRDFSSYEDAGARYDRRPSLDVVPLGDWGPGFVRLVEIPTDLEINDNIVAYFIPEGTITAGHSREFSYLLRWGDLPLDPGSDLAHISETRAGIGGVSGVELPTDERKFVIDFTGGLLSRLGPDETTEVAPVVSVAGGELVYATLEKVEGTDIWRLVVDVTAGSDGIVELSAHIAGFGRKLSEIWLNQWIAVDE